MGQEIDDTRFRKKDFALFETKLAEETELLRAWFQRGELLDAPHKVGFEIEAWLLDEAFRPAPINDAFIRELDNPQVVHELARFNIELNSRPYPFLDRVLQEMEEDLEAFYRQASEVAHDLGGYLLFTGILPSLEEAELNLHNMSELKRYRAINEQIMRQRRRVPFRLDIQGRDHLVTEHSDVMLEAATTSFQVHLQVSLSEATRCFNAAQIATAPVLALGVNSPFVFGHSLWAESRIPLFEQSVDPGQGEEPARVTFGEAYLRDSVMEFFEDNLQRYQVMLPRLMDSPPQALRHLQLHNGTIWRWNRPIVETSGPEHASLRIEHRALPAGPTVRDAVANAAFFFGLVASLARTEIPPEDQLPFREACDNFYQAARLGLEAEVRWLDGQTWPVSELIEQCLLPQAHQGLLDLGLHRVDIEPYFDILRGRVASGQTGARWQRAYVEHFGPDMLALTAAYYHHQSTGECVHTWPVD